MPLQTGELLRPGEGPNTRKRLGNYAYYFARFDGQWRMVLGLWTVPEEGGSNNPGRIIRDSH